MSDKKVIVKYLLSEEGRKSSILLGGNGQEMQEIEVEVSERILKLVNVDTDGNVYLNIGFRNSLYGKSIESIVIDYIKKDDEFGKYLIEKTNKKYFDKVSELNELLNWEENRREKLKKLKEKYQVHIEERQKKKQEAEIKSQEEYRISEQIRHEEYKKTQLEEQKKEEERKEKHRAYVDKRDNWINEYGSQYLKNAIKLGYYIDSKYAIERANKELPDFELDIDDNAGWYERINPSEKAIEEVMKLIEKGYNVEIKCLTSPVDPEDEEEFEECEAIIIRKYLGKYDLLKSI